MVKPDYAVIRLTRFFTTLCAVVVFCVVMYAAVLIFQSTMFKRAVSDAYRNNTHTVIIDAGHGGEDCGTASESGILEKNINLPISETLEETFAFFGYDTVMTRSEDTLIYDSDCDKIREKKVSDIHNRMKIIEEHSDAVFLSIHQNHFENPKYNGTQVFYSKNNPLSRTLAEKIKKTVVQDLQPDNKREIKQTGTEIYLLYHSQIPSVMVECGFLSNAEEANLLNTPEYRNKMAFDIFKGTYLYLSESTE